MYTKESEKEYCHTSQGRPSRWPNWTDTDREKKKVDLSEAIISLYFKLFNDLFTSGLPQLSFFSGLNLNTLGSLLTNS